MVAPASPAERQATALFLDWAAELQADAGQLVARAELARQACGVVK